MSARGGQTNSCESHINGVLMRLFHNSFFQACKLLILKLVWSGRWDLNSRPPAPKAGALPGCATPRHVLLLKV
jgi:hypothetical protein